ncbi:MAG: M48 family metalloprotease [Candidatus Gastranaerophilaceae bacterium]
MKKFLVVVGVLLIGTVANAEFVEVETNVNMANYWEKDGKDVQKITEIGTKIINANRLQKRIPIQMVRNKNVINASSAFWDKTVHIYSGLLPYIDSDDEMAYILGHETAHSLDSYDGFLKWTVMICNLRAYEYKADLIGIDLMVKAGYNPIAAITCANKWMGEDPFDLFMTHPKASRRLMAMYKYIYVKYPWALKTDMVHNVNYENFTYSSQKEINAFQQKQKERDSKKVQDL